jgi:hypothetical protein
MAPIFFLENNMVILLRGSVIVESRDKTGSVIAFLITIFFNGHFIEIKNKNTFAKEIHATHNLGIYFDCMEHLETSI